MKFNIILTASLMAVVLASCTREELTENPSGEAHNLITINASIINTPGTKTAMGEMANSGTDYYPLYWSTGDQFVVFSKKTANVFTIGDIDTDKSKATFTGDAGDMPLKFEGSEVFPAAYPAENAFAQINADGSLFVGSYLPFQQKYKNGTFADDVFPMATASADGENFAFYNLGGVIQIPLKVKDSSVEDELSIRSIYLTGNNEEVVAGGVGMLFDAETGTPLTDDNAAYKGMKIARYGTEDYARIIVSLDEPLVITKTETKYINLAVLPQTFEKGFTVELVDATNLGRVSYKVKTAVTVKRSTVTRLSALEYVKPIPAQVANSYVYSEAGYHLMPAYAMGNRLDVMLDVEGRNLDADLLWSELITTNYNTTDRADLIPAVTNIEYIIDDDGYGMLQFKINKDPNTGEPYRGNAAIALYDDDTKEILWSWHIWMCEPVHDVVTGGSCADGSYTYQLPDGTTVPYEAEAWSGRLVIMDRNLGAISADPADGWKTYGLYYQNGRRDPFIGGHWNGTPTGGGASSFSNPKDNLKIRYDESAPFTVGADDTAPVWYNEELQPKGWHFQGKYQNVSTALRNPMIFSVGANISNGQWTLYTDSDNKSWLDPAAGNGKGGSSGTHGNTGLSDGGHEAYWNRTKTIMDPCPVGYSVLGERGGLFLGSDTKTYTFDTASGVYGMTSKFGSYDSVWWPAAGVRTIDGRLGDVGFRGMYYHYDHISASHGGHGSGFTQSSGWATGIMTNHASSVRCVREKQDIAAYPLN